MKQDSLLAVRVIVDVASKGLSSAINDPTTAVLAIDQIHHLLHKVGKRRLDDERVAVKPFLHFAQALQHRLVQENPRRRKAHSASTRRCSSLTYSPAPPAVVLDPRRML